MLDTTAVALRAEMARARELHPGNADLGMALVEEVGEVARAMLECGDGGKRSW